MSTLPIRVRAVCRGIVPTYATPGAAGMDLTMVAWRYSDTPSDRPDCEGLCIIRPGDRVLAKTGLSIELPEGFEAQVRPRSGLSLRSGDEPVEIRCGERVAQLVVAPVVRVELDVVESLSETARGSSGFGSTGR